VSGQTLNAYLKKLENRQIESKKLVKSIFTQVLLGLEHIHYNNIVHRDLKPENIMITSDDTIKIIDFGWGFKVIANEFEIDHHRIGTLHYMAPEIVRRHNYDHKIDIWAAGVILYELWVGADPFTNKQSDKIIDNIKNNEPDYKKLPSKMKWFKPIIQKMLTKEVWKRPEASEILKMDEFKRTAEKMWVKKAIFFDTVEYRLEWESKSSILDNSSKNKKIAVWAYCGDEYKMKRGHNCLFLSVVDDSDQEDSPSKQSTKYYLFQDPNNWV